MIKELQRNAVFRNPGMAAAQLVGAQAQAMQDAANNKAGAFTGFMGMNMAGQAGGMNAQALYNMDAQQKTQQQAQAQSAGAWKCSCGATVTGKFCPECGAKKPGPKPVAEWKCPSCGAMVTGKFCPECGAKKPEVQGWTCSCGAVNTGKFCSECGAKRPEGAPIFRCDKCGWQPEDPAHPPKFCPECGDVFNDDDRQ